MSKISLTIYKIRKYIDGERVTEFHQVLESTDGLGTYEVPEGLAFSGNLFVTQTEPKTPPWVTYLQDGLDTSIEEFEESPSTSGVLVLKVRVRRMDHFFAATFGSSGRFLLKKGSYETDFGLKVALNTIYDSEDDTDNSRIRSVDSKKVAGDVFNSRIQASKSTSFEAFDLDTSGDQLRSITGSPFDHDSWGTRITGSMPVSIQFGGSFTELGALCKRLQAAYRKTDYERDFSWVDNVKMVREANQRDALLEKLLSDLQGDSENLSFVPTILLDWKEVNSFRITRVPGETIEAENPEDLLPAFIERLTDRNSLGDLTVSKLKQYRFESINGDGDLSGSATLLASVEGELDFEGEQYLVSEGDFFKVQEDYLSDLNQFVDDLTVFSGVLPSSLEGEHEGDYNERAANSSTSYLNLDKKTIRIPGKTTAIEICDVLTRTKEFIHVKRKLSSSNLSHLFAQGAVSADLFLMSSEFRSLTQEKIGEASQERSVREPGFDTNFMPFDIDQPAPRQCEIVYAIIAKWNSRGFSEAIPFFSKVNLRRICQELKRMGYRYSMCKIEVE